MDDEILRVSDVPTGKLWKLMDQHANDADMPWSAFTDDCSCRLDAGGSPGKELSCRRYNGFRDWCTYVSTEYAQHIEFLARLSNTFLSIRTGLYGVVVGRSACRRPGGGGHGRLVVYSNAKTMHAGTKGTGALHGRLAETVLRFVLEATTTGTGGRLVLIEHYTGEYPTADDPES